jgi:hypothetical protein
MPRAHQAVLDGFKRLRAAWPQRGWSQDSRFECVASTFDSDFAPQARALLVPLFPQTFDERALTTASEVVKDIATRTGGLRSAQRLMVAPSIAGRTPYALLWPWEEAQTISLRIGMSGATLDELDELYACFGTSR